MFDTGTKVSFRTTRARGTPFSPGHPRRNSTKDSRVWGQSLSLTVGRSGFLTFSTQSFNLVSFLTRANPRRDL